MNMQDIERLLSSDKAKNVRRAASGDKWFDGFEWHYYSASQVGHFEGKAGTSRRYYSNEGSVVAYLVTPKSTTMTRQINDGLGKRVKRGE